MAEPTAGAGGEGSEGLFRVIGDDGAPLPGADPGLPPEVLRALFETTLKIRILDERMFNLQRQGRISFYGAARGQEAVAVGAAAALEPTDPIFPGLRESGAMLHRGWSLERYVCQCMGNTGDLAQGRQMPCHYFDRGVEYVSWSSVIGTQIPQAVGAAYALRRTGVQAVTAAFFGDGATSSGDFHAAMTFAARWKAAVLFLCQNNQWSISVPVTTQTRARTLAAKGPAYGIQARRVDGNDILAVYGAVREAAAGARRGEGPRFLEFLTYRVGAHSTSDDPSQYRDEEVTRQWEKRDPILVFRRYLEAQGLPRAEWEETFREAFVRELADVVRKAEELPRPAPGTLFEDVYAEAPPGLREQRRELLDYLESKGKADE